MDEITSKAVIIGVSIFVTLLIVTVIIFEFEQLQSIYKNVGETNISFEERLDEFDKYRDSNNVFTGLDIRNLVKKYKKDRIVNVCIKKSEEEEICNDDINIDSDGYTQKYRPSLDDRGNKFKIIFSEI